MLITYVAFPLIVSLKATLGLPDITGQLNSVRILCGKKKHKSRIALDDNNTQ